jgi:RsiW-degrading membrane proteinase PrsW (M82 family)
MASPAILVAMLGGVLPALLWLAFWLLEDRCQPEPKRYIFLSFVLGALAVWLVLPLERQAMTYFASGSIILLFAWALIEESFKFIAAYLGGLMWAVFDEPLDAIIYLVTAALGFSAMENTLFLYTPLVHGDVLRTIVTGDLRFVGASLLHTLSSATIGISLALTYSQPAHIRRIATVVGVILAVSLHTLFNFFILGQGGDATFWVFLVIWFGIIAALLMVERVKQPVRDYC